MGVRAERALGPHPTPFSAIMGPFWAILGLFWPKEYTDKRLPVLGLFWAFFGQFAHLWIGLFWTILAILGYFRHFGHFRPFGPFWPFLPPKIFFLAKKNNIPNFFFQKKIFSPQKNSPIFFFGIFFLGIF